MKYNDLVIKLSIEERMDFDGYDSKGEVEVKCDLSESHLNSIKNVQLTTALSGAFMNVIKTFTDDKFDRENTEVFFQDVIGKMHESNIMRKRALDQKPEKE